MATWAQPRDALQESAVHGSWSSQLTGVNVQPPPGAQVSSVHALPSLQWVPVRPQQVLRLQVRPVVQATTVPVPLEGQDGDVPLQTLPEVQALPSSHHAPAAA